MIIECKCERNWGRGPFLQDCNVVRATGYFGKRWIGTVGESEGREPTGSDAQNNGACGASRTSPSALMKRCAFPPHNRRVVQFFFYLSLCYCNKAPSKILRAMSSHFEGECGHMIAFQMGRSKRKCTSPVLELRWRVECAPLWSVFFFFLFSVESRMHHAHCRPQYHRAQFRLLNFFS